METKLPLNSAFELKAQVDYRNDRAAFEQIMKTSYGGTVLFALKKDMKLAEHLAPAAVTVVLLEGEADFNVQGTSTVLKAGDALLMEAGTPHSVTALTDVKVMLVKIDN